MTTPTNANATSTRNRFESFDEFKSFVRQSSIEGSVIDPGLFDVCVEFHQDQEFDDGHEVSTPIHDALGWDFRRFGHQANEPLYAAFFKNEDGSVWQAILSIWDEEKQRPYRYFAPKEIGDRAFLPPVPPTTRKRIGDKYGIEVPMEGSFWGWVEDTDILRILTEGGKKGLSLLSQGYVGITLYGCLCGAKNKDEQERYVKPYLVSDVERFAKEDSRWLFAFDRDEIQKAKLSVASGKKKLRLALKANGCTIEDVKWTSQDGKGVDDFIKNSGSGGFDAAYQKAIVKLEKALQSDLVSDPQQAHSKKKQHLNLLDSKWGNKLRFNEMTLQVELDGEPLKLDTLSVRLAEEFDIDIGKETASEIVLYLAEKQTYHPVREYLERVTTDYPDQDLSILDNIATRYFGTKEPLHNTFMRKHLIGQVRRIFEPGCQHDTAVVLQGSQGVRKSSFWRTLAVNPDWFDDTLASSNNDKDERLKLRRFWILELAEIESVFRRKEVAGLRGFLTTKSDNLRVPYGRSIESFPRTSCFVASVNPAEFLVDPEGHRRFWVIPVATDLIPVDMLATELDQLWAAAVHAYRRGEQHWLTAEEEKRNALLNKKFELGDSWSEIIDLYLENNPETTITDILTNCLKIEAGRHDRSSQMRVAEALKRLGWEKFSQKRRYHGSNPTSIWRKVSTGSLQGVTEVSTGVSHPLNLDISSTSAISVDTLTPSEDSSQKICDSISNTAYDLNIEEKGVYTQGVTKDETTLNQGFQGCDTFSQGCDTFNVDMSEVNSPDVNTPPQPTFVTGNPKMKPQDLVGKVVLHKDGTTYQVNALDWTGKKLVCRGIDTGRQAFLILSDLQ